MGHLAIFGSCLGHVDLAHKSWGFMRYEVGKATVTLLCILYMILYVYIVGILQVVGVPFFGGAGVTDLFVHGHSCKWYVQPNLFGHSYSIHMLGLNESCVFMRLYMIHSTALKLMGGRVVHLFKHAANKRVRNLNRRCAYIYNIHMCV